MNYSVIYRIALVFLLTSTNTLVAQSPNESRSGESTDHAAPSLGPTETIRGTGTIASATMKQDTISALIGYLDSLAQNSDNALFKLHCNSILDVIGSRSVLSKNDTMYLKLVYRTFSDTTVSACANDLSSYLERKRPFILSWISPTDGAISLGWLVLPENWNPDESYPLYVQLHGWWSVCDNAIDYMTYNLRPNFFMETSFNDGYSFFPRGRGNYRYEGISETDIWESLDVLEKVVHINPERKYLTGHSMGGYGVWNLGQKTPEMWAALGVYAGSLWYGSGALLKDSIALRLRDVPVYIVCGLNDGLLSTNQTAYQLLNETGNPNTMFATFPGGHESLLQNWVGMYEWMKDFTNDDMNAIGQNPSHAPSKLILTDNYPNPFNPTTTIKYSLPEDSRVNIGIFNQLGQLIVTLVEKTELAGDHTLTVNASALSSGVYFCRIRAEGKTAYQKTQKIVLLR